VFSQGKTEVMNGGVLYNTK